MKTMLKSLLSLTFVLAATFSMAQPKLTPQQEAKVKPTTESSVKKLDEVVKLTPEQKKQITPCYEQFVRKNMELYKIKDTPEYKEEVKKNKQYINRSVNKTLTPEQNKKWTDYWKK